MPTGKATDMPAIAIAAENKMFAALKITPPSNALPTFALSACLRSSANDLPSSPILPRVSAEMIEKSRIPIT